MTINMIVDECDKYELPDKFHDQLVPCEIIVISLKHFLCFMILCNCITLNHNQQHQLSEVAFKTLRDLLRRHGHPCTNVKL
jgi:hypothetical protein